MSLWKFGDFEAEVDFGDAGFMERVELAGENIKKDFEALPKTGKESELLRAQNKVYDDFFDCIFGKGTARQMFGRSESLSKRLEAAGSIYDFKMGQVAQYSDMTDKFRVNKPVNREQRRYYQKKRDHR